MKVLTRLIPLVLAGALSLSAASIIIENESIRAGVSDNGTFGVGGSTPPGIVYDKTGTANFSAAAVNDYLLPGTPHEFFAIQYSGTSGRILKQNNNSGSAAMPTTISGNSTEVTSVTHEGNLDITQVYSLASGAKSITIDVTITNTGSEDLTNVKFARGIDPDQDQFEFGTYNTQNIRGLTIDGVAIAPQDIVYALGVNSELPISLYSIDTTTHNTSVSSAWSTNPDIISLGGNDGDGDYTINMAFSLGTVFVGETRSFKLQYLFGNTLDETIEETQTADVKLSGACSQGNIRYATIVGDGGAGQNVTITNTGDFALTTRQLKITHNEDALYSATPTGDAPCTVRGVLEVGESCTTKVTYNTTPVASKNENSDFFFMGSYIDENGDKVYVKDSCNLLSKTYEMVSDIPVPVEPKPDPETPTCGEGEYLGDDDMCHAETPETCPRGEVLGEEGCYVPETPCDSEYAYYDEELGECVYEEH